MTPYSRHRPGDDIIAHMESLLTAKATIILYTDAPAKLSYRLREGVFNSRYHEDLKKYLILREWYSFETHDDWVRARWTGSSEVTKSEIKPTDTGASRRLKKQPPPEPLEPLEPVLSEEELDSIGKDVKDALDTCILPKVNNLAGVVEGTNRFGNRVLEVFFPDAILSQSDLARLYRWTTEKGWAIIDHEEGGLTLTRKDVEEDLTWRP